MNQTLRAAIKIALARVDASVVPQIIPVTPQQVSEVEREGRSWIGNKIEVGHAGRITIAFDLETEEFKLFEFRNLCGAFSEVSPGPCPCRTLESALNYAGML